MPAEPIAVVRRYLALSAAGGPEAALEMLDPEVEWDVSRNSPEPLVLRGKDAYVAGWRDWMHDWQEFRVELEEILDGGDLVVALLKQRGLGKTSGVTVEQEMATLFTVDAGLITTIVTYGDRSEAMREAGLRPSAPL